MNGKLEIRQKKNGIYKVGYTPALGKRVFNTFEGEYKTKEEALEVLKEWREYYSTRYLNSRGKPIIK